MAPPSMLPQPLILVDCTLREGNQAPLIRFNAASSCRIAQGLGRLGVEEMEVGHPSASPVEFERVAAVARLKDRPRMIAHARALEEDVRAVYAAGAEAVGIFIGVNPLSLRSRLRGRTFDDVIQLITSSVRFAKSLGLGVRLTVEDATRTELEQLLVAFQAAADAGADRICLPDTVGCASPENITKLVTAVTKRISLPLEIHAHNDRGLAVANTMAAVRAGARYVSSSLLGIGERAGIADTAVVLANLHYESLRTLEHPEVLQALCKEVEVLARLPHDPARPVTGRHVFHHTAQLHRRAMETDPDSYHWLPPAVLGREHLVKLLDLVPEINHHLMTAPRESTAASLHNGAHPSRQVFLDRRVMPDCRRTIVVERILPDQPPAAPAAAIRTHDCDSYFLLIGHGEKLEGLEAEITLEADVIHASSPATVFIPAGKAHACLVKAGAGLLIHCIDQEGEAS